MKYSKDAPHHFFLQIFISYFNITSPNFKIISSLSQKRRVGSGSGVGCGACLIVIAYNSHEQLLMLF